jgi:hypothetical protein
MRPNDDLVIADSDGSWSDDWGDGWDEPEQPSEPARPEPATTTTREPVPRQNVSATKPANAGQPKAERRPAANPPKRSSSNGRAGSADQQHSGSDPGAPPKPRLEIIEPAAIFAPLETPDYLVEGIVREHR